MNKKLENANKEEPPTFSPAINMNKNRSKSRENSSNNNNYYTNNNNTNKQMYKKNMFEQTVKRFDDW